MPDNKKLIYNNAIDNEIGFSFLGFIQFGALNKSPELITYLNY